MKTINEKQLVAKYEELYLTNRKSWAGGDEDEFDIPNEKFKWDGSQESKILFLQYKILKKTEIDKDKIYKKYCEWQDQIDKEFDEKFPDILWA